MGATRPHNPAARGELLGATAPWQNRSQPKKNKPTLNTKLRILPPRMVGMLIYGVLTTLYLLYLGIRGEWVGPLLWPTVVIHAVLTGLLAREWLRPQPSMRL